NLLGGHLADLVLVRLARPLVDLRRLLEQDRRGRGLRDEREAAVGVRRDEDRDDQVTHLRGARVELLAELHDVQPMLSERRTDGRRWIRLTGGALELDDCGDLLHDSSLEIRGRGPMLSLPGGSQARPTTCGRTSTSRSSASAYLL